VSTNRRIVKSEDLSVNWPNDPNISSADLGNYTVSATTSGSGATTTIYNSPDNTQPYDVYAAATLNTQKPNTLFVDHTFTVGDLRITDSVYNIPASRCKVNFDLGAGFNTSFTPANGVVGQMNCLLFLNGVSYPIYYPFATPGTPQGLSGNFYRADLPNPMQTGSGVQTDTAGVYNSTLFTSRSWVNASSGLPNNAIGNSAVNGMTVFLGGVVTRTWEADLHTIDANDPVVFQNVISTFDVEPAVIKYVAQLEIQSNFSIDENSVNLKICPLTSLSTNGSLSIQPSFKRGFTKTLNSVFTLDATP